MPRVNTAGLTVAGDNLVIDRAGWQCTAEVPDEPGGRCRRIATHVHRQRHGDGFRLTALCPLHYEAAGPEAR